MNLIEITRHDIKLASIYDMVTSKVEHPVENKIWDTINLGPAIEQYNLIKL